MYDFPDSDSLRKWLSARDDLSGYTLSHDGAVFQELTAYAKVLPENLGNIEYDISEIDPSSNLSYGWEELARNAEVLQAVVRDGTASFFFHPFWLGTFTRPDGSVYPIDALGDLRRLLTVIGRLGFRFADPTAL